MTLPAQKSAEWKPQLSSEEESKLLELWSTIFTTFDNQPALKDDGTESLHRPPAAVATASSASQTSGKPEKKGFLGRFRSNAVVDGNSCTASVPPETPFPGLSREEMRRMTWSTFKHEHADDLVLRFLRHQKWDVAKAHEMMVNSLKWRQKMHLDDDIMFNGEEGALTVAKTANDKQARDTAEGFLFQVRSGKNFVRGVDRQGRPICIIRSRLHRSSDQTPEALERSIAWTFETTRLMINPPVTSALLLFDLTGFGIANMDFLPLKFMISLFDNYFPEAFGDVIVHNAPWVFQSFWRIIRGWISAEANEHVHFTNSVEDLEKLVPRERILDEFGGGDDFQYSYPEVVPGENEAQSRTDERDRLLGERRVVVDELETLTRRWIQDARTGADVTATLRERDACIERMRDNFWKLDPMLRARSFYDRWGVIQPRETVGISSLTSP